MNDLVKKLTNGRHPVVVSQYKDIGELKQSIEREFVLVKFTETNGGTELGINLNQTLTNLKDANFEEGTGIAKLVGEITLDYTRVRLIADINLNTLKGSGCLELVELSSDEKNNDTSSASSETLH